MKENEDKLLYKLTSTQGSLLDDVSLISVLNDLKRKANESRTKISSAQETELKLNAAREEYRPGIKNLGLI
jgi:dynein heavy chain